MKELFVVGLGPGKKSAMTFDAIDAIQKSEVVAGYKKYIEILRENDLVCGKKIIENGMTGEENRVKAALDEAESGKTTALVCSGDAGVYGLATLALNFARGKNIAVEIIPGITAANSAAAVLGSPISNDYAVISLSDRITPKDLIEKRLRAANLGDFCVVLYNPRSALRRDALKNAAEILLESRAKETPCGFVRNCGRSGEESGILSLSDLLEFEADMFCTIFVGNSFTKIAEVCGKKRLLTMRGYKSESAQI